MNLLNIIPNLKIRKVKPTQKKKVEKKETKQLSFNFEQEPHEKVMENLTERQKMVYQYLKSTYVDGATAKELSVALFKEGLTPSPERNSTHPRLNELVDLGLIKIIGKKDCQFTGRKVTIYKSKL